MKTSFKVLVGFFTILLIVFGIYLRFEALQSAQVGPQEWVVRDFDRAFNIVEGDYLPLAGPESNAGGRLPGPFMYFWLAIPLLFQKSYESIFAFNFLLNVASLIGTFFILQRYFNFYIGAIGSGLLSLSVHHISAINFPINPAFIFPFVTCFLWVLLELVTRRNSRMYPWMALILSLGVQFHYSMAAYILVPVSIALCLKIKLTQQDLLKTIVVVFLCFLPYMIFKAQTFEPTNDGSAATFRKSKPLTVWGAVRMVAVQNTLHRIVYSQPFPDGERPESRQIRHIGLSIFLYGFVGIVLMRTRKNGFEKSSKEVAVLVFFLVPAWTYEIVHPFTQHYWYTYIFIVPTLLVLAFGASSLIVLAKPPGIRMVLSLVLWILIGGHGIFALKETRFQQEKLSKSLTIGTYGKSRLFLTRVMDTLRLNAREVFDRVYFLDFHPSSLRRLQWAQEHQSEKWSSVNPNCFFIYTDDQDELLQNATSKTLKKQRRDIFEKDPTIKKVKLHRVVVDLPGGQKAFWADEYVPLRNQTCYKNSFNPFVTTREVRDLLFQAKDSLKQPVQTLKLEETYDGNSDLESFYGQYMLNNPETQIPVRLTLSIRKKGSLYVLKADIETYYFWGMMPYNMRFLNINLISINGPENEPFFSSSPAQRYNLGNPKSFQILFPNTLASGPNLLSSWGHWSYPQKWSRKLFLPLNVSLKKESFFLDVVYEMVWKGDDKFKFSETSSKNILGLKEGVNYFDQGNYYLQKKDYEKALVSYRAALKQFPHSAKVYNNLGASERLLGRNKEAILSFEEASKLQNNMPGPHFQLAIHHFNNQNFQKSGEHFQAVKELLIEELNQDRKKLQGTKKINKVLMLGMSFSHLGLISNQSGKGEEAMYFTLIAKQIFKRFKQTNYAKIAGKTLEEFKETYNPKLTKQASLKAKLWRQRFQNVFEP